MALTVGTSGNDTLVGTSESDTLQGLAGSDVLEGLEGNDTLYGGDGLDFLRGGPGDDTLDGGAGFDLADFTNATGPVTVDLRTNIATGEGTDTLVDIEGAYGTSEPDTLIGDDGDNVFRGNGGVDTIDGGLGADVIDYADASGAVVVDLVARTVTGPDGADVFTSIEGAYGSAFDDTLIGDDGDNILRGRAGNDTLDGAGGFDMTDYAFSSVSGVIVNLAAGTATGGAGDDTLISFEAVRGSNFNDTLYGTSGDNQLTGGSGDDLLFGGAGDDTLDGGNGFDIVSYEDDTFDGGAVPTTGLGVTVNLADHVATDNWGNSDALFGIELVWGSSHDDSLTGGDPANGSGATDGFEGFRGGAGNDTIDGGTGFDRVYYDTSPTAVNVALGGAGDGSASDGFGGTDTLRSIEEVRGSAHDDILNGSNSALFESFEGRGGNDTINGGGGSSDRVSYQTSGAGVTVDLAAGTASDGWGGTDTLSGIEYIRGSEYADVLRGDGGDNDLEGRAGDDSLFGGDGADTLRGGAGNDTLNGGAQRILADNATQNVSNQYDIASFSDATSGVTVALGSDGLNGSATGGGIGTDVLIDIEFVVGSAFGDVISGSDRAVNEIIRGGGGDDILSGGTGNGTDLGTNLLDYRFANGSVNVDLAAGLASGADGRDVLSGFQGILGSAFDDTLTGDSSDNYIEGGNGNDTINGGDGLDRASYSSATGAVTVDLSTGNATGAAGNDSLISIENLRGSGFSDLLIGNDQDNDIQGRAGDDTIQTGAGADTVHGGYGDDSIDGGDGDDAAVFEGDREAYSVAKVGMGWTVTDTSGSEGVDTLANIEWLQFADMTVALENLPRTNAPDYGKDAGFLFDGVYYLLSNPELVPTVGLDTAFLHYISSGAAQDMNPNAWFDAAYYSNKWADLAALELDDATLFMHYNLYGVWEGRSAGPKFDHFDGDRYLAENPDVALYVDANVDDFLGSRSNGAIAHFIIYGSDEQRVAYDTGGAAIDMGYIL